MSATLDNLNNLRTALQTANDNLETAKVSAVTSGDEPFSIGDTFTATEGDFEVDGVYAIYENSEWKWLGTGFLLDEHQVTTTERVEHKVVMT